MKQLTDAERLEIVMSLLDEQQVADYAEQCAELEREGIPLGMKPLLEQNPEANGFHNVPAECENFECRNCIMTDRNRRAIGCPYVDEDRA